MSWFEISGIDSIQILGISGFFLSKIFFTRNSKGLLGCDINRKCRLFYTLSSQ
jgi:hypothetical protein